MRAIDARQGHCGYAQPNRKANRPADRMDAVACTWLPQHARNCGLRGRRVGARGEVTLTEAARMLDLSPMTVPRQIRAGIIPAEQYCKGAPWVIKQQDIENQPSAKTKRKGPSSSNPDQQTLIFQ